MVSVADAMSLVNKSLATLAYKVFVACALNIIMLIYMLLCLLTDIGGIGRSILLIGLE